MLGKCETKSVGDRLPGGKEQRDKERFWIQSQMLCFFYSPTERGESFHFNINDKKVSCRTFLRLVSDHFMNIKAISIQQIRVCS